MIPSTRILTVKPPRDSSFETEGTGAVAAAEVETDFGQKNLPEVVENDDGSATVLPFPSKEEREKPDESDFSANLALAMEDSELAGVAHDLIDLIERDKAACTERDKMYAEGLRRTGMGEDAPGGADFEGASRVSHPVMAEACVDFEARAIKE